MSTMMTDAWKEQTAARMQAEPAYAAYVRQALQRLVDREHYNPLQVDLVYQVHRGPSEYDAAAFLEVWAMTGRSELLFLPVSVRDIPEPDADRDGNNRILGTLAAPFTGEFHGGAGDHDGWVAWSTDVWAAGGVGESVGVVLPPMTVPLEVGFTKPERTMLHLRETGAVARWPYGHNRVTILLHLPKLYSDGVVCVAGIGLRPSAWVERARALQGQGVQLRDCLDRVIAEGLAVPHRPKLLPPPL